MNDDNDPYLALLPRSVHREALDVARETDEPFNDGWCRMRYTTNLYGKSNRAAHSAIYSFGESTPSRKLEGEDK